MSLLISERLLIACLPLFVLFDFLVLQNGPAHNLALDP